MRVRRLSVSAVALLSRLSEADAHIVFLQGAYWMALGEQAQEQIRASTVEALASPRLITRDKAAPYVRYVITDKGRDIARST